MSYERNVMINKEFKLIIKEFVDAEHLETHNKNDEKKTVDDQTKEETTKKDIPNYLPIEDSLVLNKKLPMHVMDLIKYSIHKNHESNVDMFAVIILATAIEKGFIPIGDDDDEHDPENDPDGDKLNWSYSFDSQFVRKYSKRIPNSFWQSNLSPSPTPPPPYDGNNQKRYKLLLKLPEIQSVKVRLLISELMTSANTLGILVMCSIVNSNLTAHAEGTSIYFPIVVCETSDIASTSRTTTTMVPSNILTDITIKLKNEIFTPIRNGILSMHNQRYPGLFGLPIECMINIRKYLNASQRF